jgi:ribosomal protein S18 acetylase RimI-like enzyme
MRVRVASVEDAPGIARVHVDTWRTAYRGILPADFLNALSYEARTQRWCENLARAGPPQFTLVAEDDDGALVGFAGGGSERDGMPGYDGEIYAVYVLNRHQRLGIGRQLMAVSARHLMDQGFGAAMLWALEANGRARAFYEALGGQLIGRKTKDIADTPQIEVAYGWPDLTMLINAGKSAAASWTSGADHDPDRSSNSTSQRD